MITWRTQVYSTQWQYRTARYDTLLDVEEGGATRAHPCGNRHAIALRKEVMSWRLRILMLGILLVSVPLLALGQESSGRPDPKKQEAVPDAQRHAEDPYYDCGTKPGRYRSGEGAVVDCEQRLLWTLSDNGSDVNWDQARAYCAALGTGWGLPSVSQLQSISHEKVMEAGEWLRLTGGWYWSAERDGSAAAWIIPLDKGLRRSFPASFSYGRALCVHGS